MSNYTARMDIAELIDNLVDGGCLTKDEVAKQLSMIICVPREESLKLIEEYEETYGAIVYEYQ